MRIALRAVANGRLVCAENDGNSPLIANRDAIGEWEMFDVIEIGGGNPSPPAPSPIMTPPSPQPPVSTLPTPARLTKIGTGPFHERFYSYWANAYTNPDGTVYVFAGSKSAGPQFLRVYPSGRVEPWDARVPYGGTTEGWYFDREGWLYLIDGRDLRRVNPFTGQDDRVFCAPASLGDGMLWQPHSSEDGRVHSATWKQRPANSDDVWPNVATLVSIPEYPLLMTYAAVGVLDESSVDASGEYVVIQERIDGHDDNRVIHISSGAEERITNAAGAVGHADMGSQFMIGEDDQIGACVSWDLRTLVKTPLFSTWNQGHIAIRGSRVLLSNATALELAMTDLPNTSFQSVYRHGIDGGGDPDLQVRANLSQPNGSHACFMMRGEVYLLEL